MNGGAIRGAHICILTVALASAALCQEFEAVSVKPNKSMSGNSSSNTNQGRLAATNVSLRSLIVTGFGMKDYQVEGPDWLSTERFDVAAKIPDGLPKDREKFNAAYHAMMQSMLADRFKLATHREQKTFRVYGLTPGKSGIKFKAAPDCSSHNQNSTNDHYTGTCVSMSSFADFLARQKDLPADLPVLDMTGLAGFYDLTLSWVPESRQSGGDAAVSDTASGPGLLSALQEQLGLRLETRRAPLEILVVDRVERVPSEN